MTEIDVSGLKSVHFGTAYIFLLDGNLKNLDYCNFNSLEEIICDTIYCGIARSPINIKMKKWKFPKLKYFKSGNGIIMHTGQIDSIELPVLESNINEIIGDINNSAEQTQVKNIYIGCKGSSTQSITIKSWHLDTYCENIEIGDYENINAGLEPRWEPLQNITISNFNGLKRENVVDHILNRLGNNSLNSIKFVLKLPRTVYDLLTDEDKLISVDKNWSIAY